MPCMSVEEAVSRAGSSLHEAVSMLWELDENRLRPTIDYTLDLQKAANDSYAGNVAPRPLFRFLSPQVWQRKTFGTFRTLLNRYDPRSISVDTVDDEVAFLSAIIETPCIRFVHQWLVANGHANLTSMDAFCPVLMAMWFTEHSGKSSSAQTTGFQHVFCGEINGRSRLLSGLHNFVRVYLEEQQGNLVYMGYMTTRGDYSESPLANRHMLKIRFGLHGHEKRISSMFFGVSPEFEVGLYSLIALAGRSEIVAILGSQKVRVRAVSTEGKIRTAYPQLLERLDDRNGRYLRNRRLPVASTILGRRTRAEASSEEVSERPRRRQRTNGGRYFEQATNMADFGNGLSGHRNGVVEVIDLTPRQPRRRYNTRGSRVSSQCPSANRHQQRMLENQSDVVDLTLDKEEHGTQPKEAELLIDLTAGH